jgi:hypothetical protein
VAKQLNSVTGSHGYNKSEELTILYTMLFQNLVLHSLTLQKMGEPVAVGEI